MKKGMIILMIFFTSVFAFSSSWENFVPEEYVEFLQILCYEYKVPVEIVAAIGTVESNWRNTAVNFNSNNSNDIGIFQLNSNYIDYFEDNFWHNPYEEFDPINPYHNIEIAVKYLKWLRLNTNSWEEAVVSYNVGINAVKRKEKMDSQIDYLTKVISVMVNFNQEEENAY